MDEIILSVGTFIQHPNIPGKVGKVVEVLKEGVISYKVRWSSVEEDVSLFTGLIDPELIVSNYEDEDHEFGAIYYVTFKESHLATIKVNTEREFDINNEVDRRILYDVADSIYSNAGYSNAPPIVEVEYNDTYGRRIEDDSGNILHED